jgi:hypothetical protein
MIAHTKDDKIFVYTDSNKKEVAFILQLYDNNRCMILKDETASLYQDVVYNTEKMLKIIEILLEN